MDPYLPSPDEANRLSPRFLEFVGFSVGLAYVISLIGGAIGMSSDSSWYLQVVGRIDWWALPVAVLFIVGIFASCAHVIARISTHLFLRSRAFKGPRESTVNAALALAAWMLPVSTALVVVLRVLIQHMDPLPTVVVVAVALPFGILFWLYATAALAAAHRIPFEDAWMTVLVSLALVGIIDFLAEKYEEKYEEIYEDLRYTFANPIAIFLLVVTFRGMLILQYRTGKWTSPWATITLIVVSFLLSAFVSFHLSLGISWALARLASIAL
jgi:hypothetical protein